MNDKKLKQLLIKQQNEYEEMSLGEEAYKKIANKVWVHFHRKNFFMLTALVISIIITTLLIYDEIGTVIINKNLLDPLLLFVGLGLLITISITVIGIFLLFLTDD